jgi:two-component system, LytTR family, response regulator
MRSLIVDDEAAARSRLRRLLAGHSEIEVIGEARDGLEALAQIERLQPDLLFLDIEMPGLSGFDVLRSISSSVALPLVIFVTGYDQHALAAFDANALAYLLKPVEADRLAHDVDRARRLDAVAGDKETERQRISRAVDNAPRVFRQIVGRKRDGLVLMAPENILWFDVRDGDPACGRDPPSGGHQCKQAKDTTDAERPVTQPPRRSANRIIGKRSGASRLRSLRSPLARP